MKFNMNILTLKFKDANVEAEFAKLFHSISPRFYHIIIALLGISSLIFSILSFNMALIGEGIGTLACSIAFFAILWYRNKLCKIIPLVVFIAAEVVLGVGLYYTKVPFSYLSPKAIFYEGFSFGLYTILLSQFFPTLPNKLAFIIIAIICRYSILVPDSLGSILVNSIFDVTSVFLMFYQEKNIRDLFKRFHDYRDELSKFKSLLAYHIPQNIAIIRKDLDQKIFINNSFTNKFKAETISQILSTASTLKIIKNTYDTGTAQEMENLFQRLPAPTLYDFLNACKNNNQNTMQIACFNVASTESEEAQVTYEAKVFNLNWDDCEALTIMLNDLTVQETILALKLADENKDRVLATVSHELRTPINGMLGITNLIEQDFQDTKLREYCKAAKICSKMLLNLVNSILDLSQIRNNCIKLNPTCFTIKELLDEIESIFHSQCLNKGLEFKIVSEEEYSEKIVSDRSRLTQVIVNLLANALKFTFQGEITLKVLKNRKGNEINFRIEDTGTGIKDEDKPKLFKMFGRVEQTDSTINTQGVGLGLTISNSLVKLLNPTKQNAKIELESEYGKGTTFFFAISRNLVDLVQSTEEDHSTIENLFFPEDRHGYALFPGSISEFSPKTDFLSPRIITTPTQKLLSPSMLSRMKKYKEVDCPQISNFTVSLNTEERDLLASSKLQCKRTNKLPDIKESMLVVDDNALNLMIIAKLIEKKGYLVTTAFNGEDAIKKAKQQGKSNFFKVILMDCQMPIMDGFEATRILNQMMEAGEIPKIPIFALTANDTKQDQEKCLNAGMAAYLSKPLNEFELKKAIAKFAK